MGFRRRAGSETIWYVSAQHRKFENNQVQGNKLEREKDNIRENILRYPQVMRQLERECQLAEKIQQLEDELYYPKYYAYAK